MCISVAEDDRQIYAATPYALLMINKEDYTVQKMTKVNGLSDMGISVIKNSAEFHTLVIAYANGNIDLIKNGSVINIPDIKQASIFSNKAIHDIFFIEKYAYLSCGFGIVVLDMENEEIFDLFYIGPNGSMMNVFSLTKDNQDTLFAATEQGIYLANAKSPNLANFESWKKDTRIDTNGAYNTISYFSGQVIVNKHSYTWNNDTLYRLSNGQWNKWIQNISNSINKIQSTNNYLCITFNYFVRLYKPDYNLFLHLDNYNPGNPYPLDAITDKESILWIGDSYSGLVSYNLVGQFYSTIKPGGPLTTNAFNMSTLEKDLYIAPGGRDGSYVPLYFPGQIYHFNSTYWQNISGLTDPLMISTHDVVNIAVDPIDSRHVFAGTYGSGLLELYDDSAVVLFTENNSTLSHHSASNPSDIRVGGTIFDRNGNLWVVCSHTNKCLSMKKGDQWYGFTIPLAQENDLGQIITDNSDQQWIIMRYGNMNPYSILVFNCNGTPENPSDDNSKKLNNSIGNGNIPGNHVFSFSKDRNGKIWIGTENGVGVFASPENIFSGQNFDCYRPIVEQGGYYQYLLENETVTAIAIDDANRKWFGTDNEGVYLFSDDGTILINHFTEENSPLFSNQISSIAINNSGEIFIGTDKGIISYRKIANDIDIPYETQGICVIKVFPNPFHQILFLHFMLEYPALATINIIDISGKLILKELFNGCVGENKKMLNLHTLTEGIYLLKIQIGDNIIWNKIIQI